MTSPSKSDHEAMKRKAIVNPYLRPLPSSEPHRVRFPQLPLMGLSSKQRVGAVKASKRFGSGRNKATKRKNKQKKTLAIPGSLVDGMRFNPKRHCVVCRAVSLGCTKPHRAHHERCHRNAKTKGRVVESFLVETASPATTPAVAAQISKNTYPFMTNTAIKRKPTQTTFFPVTPQTPALTTASQRSQASPKRNILGRQQKEHNKFDLKGVDDLSLGKLLRSVLERQYAAVLDKTSDKHEKLDSLLSNSNKSLPDPIALLFSYITECTQIPRRPKQGVAEEHHALTVGYVESLAQRYKYFPQTTAIFTFPNDPSLHPFPPYHSIEGMSVFLLDWESMFPDIVLPKCMERGCAGTLLRDRTNFSKNKTLFPVFVSGGLPMWGSVMVYKCESCHASWNGNDGCFLAQLDDHIASAYPVEPRYALANYRFHLSIDLTEELESIMLSNGSGDAFSKRLHRSQCNSFKRMIRTYASKAKISQLRGGYPENWSILFEEWNGKFVPSGAQLRSYYLDGETSPLTPYGYSNQERYRRELQQVGKDINYKAAAIDWTFQVLKTYVSLPGAKACFTFKASDGQMAGVAIVRSTAVAEISHFLIQLVSKRSIKVQVLYTDLWPCAETFWKNIFGHFMTGRLGLFHAMKRITDTFRKATDREFLQAGMNDLKKCFYSHDPDDLGNLYSVLKNGSMSQDGHKYSDAEIQCMEKSRAWGQRYGKYLRKNTHPSHYIEQKLRTFCTSWKAAKDEKSRKLFTDETENTIQRQLKHIVHVSDPPGVNMYREVQAGPRSKHGLSEWHSLRMESQLEKGHHLMAHYGNTGMGTQLADCLILRGITESNTKIRFKYFKKNAVVPSHLEDTPFYWDSSELAYINEKLKQASLTPVFLGIKELPPDNGEVFLSQYFYQQNRRNQQYSMTFDSRNNKCNCPECANIPFPLVPASSLNTRIEPVQRTPPALSIPPPPPSQPVRAAATRVDACRVLTPTTPALLKLAPISVQVNQYLEHATQHNPQQMIPNPTMAPPPLRQVIQQPVPTIHQSPVNSPFYVSTNYFSHRPHAKLPPQCCCGYPPYYCPARLTWMSHGGPTFWPHPPPPHNKGCPAWRPRGPVASPFLHLNK